MITWYKNHSVLFDTTDLQGTKSKLVPSLMFNVYVDVNLNTFTTLTNEILIRPLTHNKQTCQ